GQPFDITVTAKDQFDNTATGYTGTVHFTSTDGHATLPADTIFAAADQGVRAFVAGPVLGTSGNQTITSTDTNAQDITGTSATITVNPGAATVLVVTAQAAAAAGTPFDVTVEAQDGFGNRATGYAGTVHFDITDSTADALGNHTFNPGTDAGNHTFSVTLHKAGQWTVTATDISSPISGTSGTITLQPGKAARVVFQTQPANTVVDVAIPDFGIEVQDADGNLVGSSSAAITIAIGNDPTVGSALLSGTAAVNASGGAATFSGLKLNKAGSGYTLTASSDSLTLATSDAFNAGKGAATLSLSNL